MSGEHHDHDFERALDELGCEPVAPDLTRSIMGQLGYMPAASGVVRRRARRRWMTRLSSAVAAVLIVAAGAAVYQAGPWARRPQGPTVPGALGREVDLHQRRLNETLESFWKLAPRITPAPPTETETDVDRAVLGPIC